MGQPTTGVPLTPFQLEPDGGCFFFIIYCLENDEGGFKNNSTTTQLFITMHVQAKAALILCDQWTSLKVLLIKKETVQKQIYAKNPPLFSTELLSPFTILNIPWWPLLSLKLMSKKEQFAPKMCKNLANLIKILASAFKIVLIKPETLTNYSNRLRALNKTLLTFMSTSTTLSLQTHRLDSFVILAIAQL